MTSDRPCLAGPPQALFGCRHDPGTRFELQEGQSLECSGANYCVERIDLNAAQAIVARLGPGDREPSRRRLTPRQGEPAGPGNAGQAGPGRTNAALSHSP